MLLITKNIQASLTFTTIYRCLSYLQMEESPLFLFSSDWLFKSQVERRTDLTWPTLVARFPCQNKCNMEISDAFE